MIEPIPDKLERTLRQTLAPGERVLIKLRGAFQESLVCTDTRVLILKSGWMTGQILGTDTFQCHYANIAGAEVNFHLLTGYFELSTGGMQGTPKSFWEGGASRLLRKPQTACRSADRKWRRNSGGLVPSSWGWLLKVLTVDGQEAGSRAMLKLCSCSFCWWSISSHKGSKPSSVS